MLQFSPFRAFIVTIVTLMGILFTLPNLLPNNILSAMPDWFPKNKIVLGLDLQGGSHLLLQVNREEIISERIKNLRRDARSILANEYSIGNLITTKKDGIIIELTDPTRLDAAIEALKTLQVPISDSLFAGGAVQEIEIDKREDGKIEITLTKEGIDQRVSSLVTQSIEVIRKRIDELGTTEPVIQRQGVDRVLVQVPGFDDSARLKELISKTARLTFHMVYSGLTPEQARIQGLPVGTIILPSQDGGEELIYEDVALGGESLVDAQPGFNPQTNQPIVTFRFDTRGAIIFGEITAENVGRRFAIVLDNEVITAPVIQSPIPGGTGQIEGSFTPQSANDLAVLLRAGALPATLDIIEERTVGPSLGADSVAAGLMAGIVGAIGVILFMLIAYGRFGVIATISLLINITLILGALSMLGATLTLPGIAGIVLTIGMAVDANVLIFERIREEMTAGRSVYQAIEAGFKRALTTIVDANVTTLIAAVILFFLGSGPIQGFAVTLSLGIVSTLFTAYLVTLFLVSRYYAIFRPKKLKIQLLRIIPDGTKIPFMDWRKIAITISTIAIIGSLGLFFIQGLNLGIDFKGGSAIEVQAKNGDADIAEIRSRLSGLNLGDVSVQGFGTPKDVLIRIEEQPGGDSAQQEAVKAVYQALGETDYEIRRTESVGPTVSGELAVAGAIAVFSALGAVLVYIWFRFEWQFAIGAIIALFHDVILTIGLYSLAGLEFNLSSIAAILTIVGYSLNDTVVVYDRVREKLRKYKKMEIKQLLNFAINMTLSRTVLTSITTLIALLSLVIFGGEVIRGFTISMTWGVLVGTYSSIFIAAPVLLYLKVKSREDIAKENIEKREDGAAV